jgi:hypothetical protein
MYSAAFTAASPIFRRNFVINGDGVSSVILMTTLNGTISQKDDMLFHKNQQLEFRYDEALRLIFQDTVITKSSSRLLTSAFPCFNKSSFQTARIPFHHHLQLSSITG